MTFSVVIPAFNAAGYIVEALDSVARQSALPDEVLVVDDGSRDDTGAVVRAWFAANPACNGRLLEQPNGGIPVARNAGIRACGGDWIALLDADDVWEADHMAALRAALAAAPDALAAYGAGRLLVDGVVQPRLYDDFWDNPSRRFGQPIPGSDCLRIDRAALPRLIKGNFIKPSSLLMARSAARHAGLFDEGLRVSEDREFFIRLLLDGDFIYTPNAITQYRWHADNASGMRHNRRNMEYALRALHCVERRSGPRFDVEQQQTLQSETAEAVRQYLYTCALDGFPAYAAGWRLVSALYGSLFAVRHLKLRHVVRGLLRTMR
ncbi:glycosyltransferase involved in cell wall biosynthesis [Duganella sp. 1411]|uniref:glycosyltransferase family 2 protein n=1 Tax=Duganella sp. 1411 TaxID=2806572 RepID=UPI001AE69D10|nr:glycosyltransferase family 2 protein [Duganella sp. 1411]MBP1202286.1 glycosyltransferase involved in cell wall biosynthesis [Duganella sp. 1411]